MQEKRHVRSTMSMNMFCCQCEETVNNYACELKGVCGKDRKQQGFRMG